DGIRDLIVTGVQTCALPILGVGSCRRSSTGARSRPTTTRTNAYGALALECTNPSVGNPGLVLDPATLSPLESQSFTVEYQPSRQIGRASCRERVEKEEIAVV